MGSVRGRLRRSPLIAILGHDSAPLHGGTTRLKLFVAMCVLGGVGGFVGSVIGAAFGARNLFVGGFLGGLLIAPVSGKIALWRGWILQHEYWPTVAGAAVGFLAAALVAVNTLSSPVGPILSTALTGFGALIGRRSAPNRRLTEE